MKTLANVIIWLNFIIGLSFADYLSLEGSEWTAINRNKSISAKARVPGSIYSDLRRDTVLKEALYKGDNDIKYSWVANDDWTYERTFNVESSLLSHESVVLVAHGIDTVSSIHINDKLIGNTDNMFVRYKFDAKQALKVGSNKISIAFKSAPNYGKEQSEAYKKTYGYSVPPGDNRNFVRKMQSSFSWDWGPSFPTQGIWKPIGIEAYNSAILRDFSVETTPDAKNSSLWTLTITAHLETAANKEIEGSFSIQLDEHKLVDNQNHALKPENGNTVKVKFVIPLTSIQITPWFPNGVADNTQKLYKLDVSLSVANSKEVSTKSVKIGFRKIELIQEPVKPDGLTFWFKVNGKPFFAKGSNWIPANILTEDISQEYLRYLLESAKEANMNMLRVWGGGIYETEWFYELTDELGIMLWQDMMFACALYPSDPNFLKSVDAEILDQVRRIQYHPSIAIWAGNNENQAALMDHWYNHDTTLDEKFKKDYVELYANHIRKIILAEDTSRPFVGSSPSNGLRSEQYNFIDTCPGCSKWGDVHFYDYNSPLWNWKVFPNARFSSEYGFQSYPSLETLSQVIDEKDLTYPVSNALIHHQRHGGGDSEMEKMIGHYFNLPSHGGKDRFNDMIYLSQVTQAMAMRTETEFYRRNRQINSNGEGYTMGALYWQLNDIWQGPTWASIEFGGKWKVLHNYAKNFFNNQLVSPFEDGTQIKISFVRDDYLGDLTFNLSIKVFKWSSLKPIHEIKSEVKSGSFSANIVYDQPIANLLKESNCADKSECVVLVEAENAGHKIATHNFMLLSEPKNSKIVKPNVKLVDVKEKSNDNNRHVYDIVLSAEAVAPFVYLDFKLNSQIMGKFSDNGHFIFMSPTTIQFETKSNVSAQQIKDNLIIKTVTDIA